jgi:hypothetical protein
MVLIALTSSVSNVELQPGDSKLLHQVIRWIGEQFSLDFGQAYYPDAGGEIWLLVFRTALIIMLIGLPLAVVYFIISPQFRRQVLRKLAIFLTIFILLLVIAERRQQQQIRDRQPQSQGMEGFNLPIGSSDAIDNLRDTLKPPPLWLIIGASFLLSGIIVLILIFIFRMFWLMRRNRSPLPELSETAQQTVQQIDAGGNFANAVLRCYAEMSRTLSDCRGIRHGYAMTPREFEAFLSEFGLPAEPVHQLTRIFEMVRYGNKAPRKDDEAIAIASLQVIVTACQHTS